VRIGRIWWHDADVPPSVFIVDDHWDFRVSARDLLESQGFEVVGEAAHGEEVLATISRVSPDMVLLDVQLPGRNGFAVAEDLAVLPDPPIVVLISSRDAGVYARQLASTVARGFISKSMLSGPALAAFLD
jgi:DNA-binding NarL/FixJ family response regulator